MGESTLADFHFLRPWWLVLLPVGAWLIWQLLRGRADGGGWRAIVEPALRAHVLAEPEVLRESRWPLLAAAACVVLAVVALAGPAWERLPVPAFRSEEALVVALDLSRSMDATDVEPSRLSRARLKLLDLLELRTAGQTALVVFSTHAFTVTPLTTDTRTIAALAGAVNTGIMPTQGSSLSAGLDKAAALLRQTGLQRGEILAITDAEVTREDLDLAGDLSSEGYRVSVLAVGTEQGAPIARPEGGFLTDDNGQVVIPQLDAAGLQRVASAGGGRFARLAPDDRDITSLFPSASLPPSAALEESGEQYEADVWRDRGLYLALALLPLLLLSFRRGWICGVVLLVGALPTPRADAFEWPELWKRPDQRGYEALQSNDAERAAALFEDPQWRGAAQYRAGQFPESAASLQAVDDAEGHYNRGNALAKAGRLEEAIGAYDRAIELDPNHADAIYNRDVVKDFLEKNPEAQPPNPQQGEGQQNQQSADDSGSSGESEEANGESSQEEGDQSQQQASESQQSDGRGSQDEPEPGEEEANGEQQQAANQPEREPEQGEAAGAQDVEEWASEQAAEQWLRRIPQDPGGLLRRKFQYQYQRFGVDQDGNSVLGDAQQKKPW